MSNNVLQTKPSLKNNYTSNHSILSNSNNPSLNQSKNVSFKNNESIISPTTTYQLKSSENGNKGSNIYSSSASVMDDYVNANMKKNNLDYGIRKREKTGDKTELQAGAGNKYNSADLKKFSQKGREDIQRDQIYNSLQKSDGVGGKLGSPKKTPYTKTDQLKNLSK